MGSFPRPGLITHVTPLYQRLPCSLFRMYQEMFLERYGHEVTGKVIELGGEKQYDHGRHFPAATSFACSNVARDYDLYVDATQMPFEDGSQDAFVCLSVLEHIYDLPKALREIDRTLRPGGAILLAAPFAYPVHDEADYWRLSAHFYPEYFKDYDVRAFVHLGGLVSTIADVLQRPRKGRRDARHRLYRLLGALVAATLGRFDRVDGFPLGFGIYAVKR